MKKICTLLLALVLVLSLAACSSKDVDNLVDKLTQTTDAPKDDNKATEAVTPEGTANTTEPTNAPISEPIIEPTVTTEPTATPEPTVTVAPEPTEEPVTTPVAGNNSNGLADEELLTTILNTYSDYLHVHVEDENYENFDSLHFGLAFIDDDDIPELIMADYDYHAAGAQIIFYNDGNLVNAGEFGEYGGFAYGKYDNRILSYYMGMGIECLTQLHIDDNYAAVNDFYMEGDINDNTYFKIDDKDVTEAEFEELYDLAFEGEEDRPVIWATYETMIPFYPNLCQENDFEVFLDMYEQLLDPGYIRYSGYKTLNMRSMEGVWNLFRGEIITEDPELHIYYDSKDSDQNSSKYELLSEATISDYAGFWLSVYENGQRIEDLSINTYAMPMTFFNGGITEAIDYGWSVICEPQDGLEWECYMCLDDEDHLIIVLCRDTGSTYTIDGAVYPKMDWITLYYERSFHEYDYNFVTATITRSPENDKDGKYAFIAKEYVYVAVWDEELINQYNLPKELDGKMYEIVDPGVKPYIFYIDDETYIIDTDRDVQEDDVIPVEDFLKQTDFGEYTVCFDGVNEQGTNEGLTAICLFIEYLD